MSSNWVSEADKTKNFSDRREVIQKELFGAGGFKTPEERDNYIKDPKNRLKIARNFVRMLDQFHESMKEKMGSKENYDKFIDQVFPNE